jgi:uncharacterized membrane protein YvbJ
MIPTDNLAMYLTDPSLVTTGALIVALLKASSRLTAGQVSLKNSLDNLTGAVNRLDTLVETADNRLDEHEVKIALQGERLQRHDNRITKLEDEL